MDCDDKISFLEYFRKFIDEDIWQLFAEKRNVYANQFLASNRNLKPRSRARSWIGTKWTEMKTLLEFSFFKVLYRSLRMEFISTKGKVL